MATLLPPQNLELCIDPEQNALANGQNVTFATDYSGKGRTIAAPSNYPVNSTGGPNGKRIFIWDGTSKPLANSSTFPVQCGFVVVKINEALFSNYSGILTDAAIWAFLVGNSGTANLYDSAYAGFEYRMNDGVYLAPHPGPMNVYRILYFKFPFPVSSVGIQFGQDRADTARKAKMSLAFAALYSDSSAFDDPVALRSAMQVLATNYALPLAAENPFVNKNYSLQHREYYSDDGEDFEKVTVDREYQDGGKSFNEVNAEAPQEWTLIYSGMSTQKAEVFDAHWRDRRISRPFQLLTKKGVMETVYYKSKPKRVHRDNKSWVQSRQVELIKYPSVSSLVLVNGSYVING